MIILTIRTDKPEAELGLYSSSERLAYSSWQAHRQLAETIHSKINDLIVSKGYELKDIQAAAVYKGPGSFTGLRIGISVANALASSLDVPIVSEGGEEWLQKAHARLADGGNEHLSVPEYGSPPHVTVPKH